MINMETMEQLAFIKEHGLFKGLSEMTEYAALDKEQRRAYDADLKAYRDLNSTLHFAASDGFAKGEVKGRKEGRAEEKKKTARLLHSKGMDLDFISQITGLTHDEIQNVISAE